MEAIKDYARRFADQIRIYNALIEAENTGTLTSLKALNQSLSRLIEMGEALPDAYSETDIEPPDIDSNALRKNLGKRFPTFGWYNPDDLEDEELIASDATIGDAIDDLADIYVDLRRVLFSVDRGDPANGLWYAKIMFFHWGEHAQELKSYVDYQIAKQSTQ
ncbi:MAG TPA: DUF5063 domain-containing protein [Parvularculaceae bacterium]|nr:DUF5063 domain-containing protein [Parvularculaceae bacterium]